MYALIVGAILLAILALLVILSLLCCVRTLKSRSKLNSGHGKLNRSRELCHGYLHENNPLDICECGEPSISIEIVSDEEDVGIGYQATKMEMDVIPSDRGDRSKGRSQVVISGSEPTNHEKQHVIGVRKPRFETVTDREQNRENGLKINGFLIANSAADMCL